jgi:hypothetical protein
MKNGKEYQQSIHQQIVHLLEKAYLGNDERIILNKLDFGRMKILVLWFYFCLNRNFITGFIGCV